MTVNRATLLLLLLLLPLLPAVAKEEEPTPTERVAALRHDLAEKHFRLGNWAKGKKLLSCAFAHYRMAIRLEPDHRGARGRLGHRKGEDGTWTPKGEKEWVDARGAWDKQGEAFEKREQELFVEEVDALEELGLALEAEGEKLLARPLLRRVLLLDGERAKVARALGYEVLGHSFAKASIQKEVTASFNVTSGGSGLLSETVGTRTLLRSYGSATAETTGSAEGAANLAKIGHRAQLLTALRFGQPPAGPGWVLLVVARDVDQWNRFIDRLGLPEVDAGVAKRIFTLRGATPRHFLACCGPSGEYFSHCVAEHVLVFGSDGECPVWLHEAVGIDASITLLGVPGIPCTTYESSTGLTMKEALSDHRQWARRMLRRAATGDMAQLKQLVYTQIQAMGPEDVMASWLYYRYLLLEYRDGLPKYLDAVAAGDDPEENFAGAFGESAESVTKGFLALLLGE